MDNTLYYGDNLRILADHLPAESVDLIYLDPPFNSKQDYNILFKEQGGEPALARVRAFSDTWRWSEIHYHEFCRDCRNDALVRAVQGFVEALGRNDVTAYLVMMAPRLMELRRVLKPTGSLYLHCDPTASHYLKMVLDLVFGPKSFENEIVWWYRKWSASNTRFLRNHDTILFYSKEGRHTYDVQYVPLAPSTLRRFGGKRQDFADDARTRKVPTEDESAGSYMPDVWPINLLSAAHRERLGYPTQKPLALLERIVLASSNRGDVVLDPFCGCGTAVVAANKLGRRWCGIDITHLAVSLIKARLEDSFELRPSKDYVVVGEPATSADAAALAVQDRYEFQKWAVSLVPRAFPCQAKKGADSGVDGVVRFQDDDTDPKRCVVQIKSGKVQSSYIRDFRGVIQRESATLGFFITLEEPTAPMLREAESLGFYTTPLGGRPIQRLQIRTVAQLLAGHAFDIPRAAALFGQKQAAPVSGDNGQGIIPI